MKCWNCGYEQYNALENCQLCGASLEGNRGKRPRSFFYPFKQGRNGTYSYSSQAYGFLGTILGLTCLSIVIASAPAMNGWSWCLWILFLVVGGLLVLRRSLTLDQQRRILILRWGLLFTLYSKSYPFDDFHKVELYGVEDITLGGESLGYGKVIISTITLVGKHKLVLFSGMGNLFYGKLIQRKYGTIAQAISRITGISLGSPWDGVR